ncbi:MAG: uracil-DNA glycosylase [Hyphomicrobiaceae bacterium]
MSPFDLTAEPDADCNLCPRLVAFRQVCATSDPSWFNGAVRSFGDPLAARLMIVGLAPGLRGANRTGRSFTGDQSGALLYSTLLEFGFAQGSYDGHADDGLHLVDTIVTNAVRCVPPGNKPNSSELNTCRMFLTGLLHATVRLRVIVALGRVAHDATLGALERRKASYKFAHGARHELGETLVLYDSYHCSRYNTNTGRLTPEMFDDVFRRVRAEISTKPSPQKKPLR